MNAIHKAARSSAVSVRNSFLILGRVHGVACCRNGEFERLSNGGGTLPVGPGVQRPNRGWQPTSHEAALVPQTLLEEQHSPLPHGPTPCPQRLPDPPRFPNPPGY
ncbi:hypothetical protein BSLG_001484 [Batrachochytrium salamandrivorans]|nr:hypothetical protein BSLG_001484 [Batrachochytrium salamandrivorans]